MTVTFDMALIPDGFAIIEVCRTDQAILRPPDGVYCPDCTWPRLPCPECGREIIP